MKHRFATVLRPYLRPYTLLKKTEGTWKGGKYTEGEPERVALRGVIQPLGRKILQEDGGRYDEDDRNLYTTNAHAAGDEIEYKGKRYTVTDDDDRSDYSDAYQYVLKRVEP